MNKHTPGPWYTERQEDMSDGNGYVWAIKGKRLSEEKNANGGWKHYVQNPAYANSEANARLIASAPVMLEALQEIVVDLEEHLDSGITTPIDCSSLLPKLHAAIAKAIGCERCQQ